jgi:hypothetical protein
MCGHGFRIELASGIHATRLPAARQEIVDGSFQVVACQRCEHRMMVEGSMIYTDFERHQYVAVECLVGMTADEALHRHQTIFAQSFEHGPPIAQDMGKGFRRRLVFGLPALREKLLIWDAGLDDHVVEAVKGDVLARQGLSPQEAELRVAGVLEGGHIVLARWDPRPQPVRAPGQPVCVPATEPRDFDTVPAPGYAERARDRDRIARDYPWLGDDWLVDISQGPVFAIV